MRDRTNRVLLERDRELDALASAAVAASSGAGGILLFEGPAGIGKTALIQRAGTISRDAGMRVLGARGGELERDFGFGVVGQLFEPAVRGAAASHLLSGPAVHAAPIFAPLQGGAADDEPRGERTLPVLHGLYWLAVNLSEEQPLALLIDDAHWARYQLGPLSIAPRPPDRRPARARRLGGAIQRRRGARSEGRPDCRCSSDWAAQP